MEICDGLPEDGLLVVNGDDPRLAAVVPPRHIRKVQFGVDSRFAQVTACDIISSAKGERFCHPGQGKREFSAEIPAVGRHNIYNCAGRLHAGDPAGSRSGALRRCTVGLPDHRHAPAGDRSGRGAAD